MNGDTKIASLVFIGLLIAFIYSLTNRKIHQMDGGVIHAMSGGMLPKMKDLIVEGAI